MLSFQAFSQGGNGTNCNSASSFCSDANYTFPNVTNTSVVPGPDYGCIDDPNLNGMQNPSWHYFEIDQGGTLEIKIEQQANNGTGLDLDFAMWGPYPDLSSGCADVMAGNSPPIQCSSAPDDIETIGLGTAGGSDYWYNQGSTNLKGASTPPAAQAGEVYIVVITNASNSNGTLSFTQSGGTGSTDCNIIDPQPCSINNLTATAICNGDDVTTSGSFSVAPGTTSGSITVTSSCGGTQTFNPPFTSTSASLNFSFADGPGDGSPCTITVSFSDDPACTASTTITKPDCNVPCDVVISPKTIALCAGDNQVINANHAGGVWTSADPSVATVSNGTVTGVDLGTTAIYYNLNGCLDTATVTVNTSITPEIAAIGPICEGEDFVLPGTSINGVAGTWTPAKNTTETTTYFFTPSNTSCATPVSVTVVVHPIGTATSITATDSLVLEGNSTNLNAVLTPYLPGSTYEWDPSESLNCSDCPNPIASPTSPTWYHLTVTTPEGCEILDSIYIDYRINCGEVYIPNIFSPNQDGHNDVFKAYGRCLKDVELTVFDRWGNKVFFSNDHTIGWDGTFRDKPMNSGSYVYKLIGTLLYGDKIEMKGSVTLVR